MADPTPQERVDVIVRYLADLVRCEVQSSGMTTEGAEYLTVILSELSSLRAVLTEPVVSREVPRG